ncbi:MAG: TIGR04013 family B12-binding domain/radical SAM domain-containing protein [Candidatus Heimdallarchaeaceae archaeon]
MEKLAMLKKKYAIIFELKNKNFYSLTPLIATIDNMPQLEELEVLIVDEITPEILRAKIEKYDKIVVGFSFRTAQLPNQYEKMSLLYSALKPETLSNIIFIAGGSHASGDPLSTLRMGFDYAFIGEAEQSLTTFLKQFLENEDLHSTPGIAYLDDSKLVMTKRPPLINLDNYPFISKRRGLYPPLEITRGCSFGCTFCQVPYLFRHRVRHRSIETILNVVKWMASRNLYDIRFITPNSFGYMSYSPKEVNTEAVIDLISSIKNTPGIRRVFYGTFPGEVRPETVSDDLVRDIKPLVANSRIAIGLQSGSDEVLKQIRRGHTVNQGIEAVEILLKYDFTPVVDFIFGIPGASEDDEEKSLNVIEHLTKEGAIVRAHVFMPLPGTPLANEKCGTVSKAIRKRLGTLNKKKIIEGNWSNQEKYAMKTWETLKRISEMPIIKRSK